MGPGTSRPEAISVASRQVGTTLSRLALLLGAVLTLGVGVGCSEDSARQCPEADDPLPTTGEVEVAYAPGPDLAHGCADPNPTHSSDVICVGGEPPTGRCCGDLGWPLFCRCGAWTCPSGTILISECRTHCEDDPPRPDGGQ